LIHNEAIDLGLKSARQLSEVFNYSHLIMCAIWMNSRSQKKQLIIGVHLPMSGRYFRLRIKDETFGRKLAGFGFRQIYSLWHVHRSS
jgi:hypothetical protein